jgi:hypothetical protein
VATRASRAATNGCKRLDGIASCRWRLAPLLLTPPADLGGFPSGTSVGSAHSDKWRSTSTMGTSGWVCPTRRP